MGCTRLWISGLEPTFITDAPLEGPSQKSLIEGFYYLSVYFVPLQKHMNRKGSYHAVLPESSFRLTILFNTM